MNCVFQPFGKKYKCKRCGFVVSEIGKRVCDIDKIIKKQKRIIRRLEDQPQGRETPQKRKPCNCKDKKRA